MDQRISLPNLGLGESISLLPTGSNYYSVDFKRGVFKIELWGASAGDTTFGRLNAGGKGGYTSGVLKVKQTKTFYFFIGTNGTDSNRGTPGLGGFNGGVNGANDNGNFDCSSGGSGGATDMRIIPGFYNSETSLLSRVMVAGGGGSAGCYTKGGKGGDSGGISGNKGADDDLGASKGGNGGNQTNGFSLGSGGKGVDGNEAGGCGGGGYWGGFGGKYSGSSATGSAGGGGGSSFISGHSTCIAMDLLKKPLPDSIHPSLVVFSETMIISGGNTVPSVDDPKKTELSGHKGNGECRITFLRNYLHDNMSCQKHLIPHCFHFILLQLYSF